MEGATLNSNRNNEQILSDKLSQNLKEKRVIGQFAAKLIEDNDCILWMLVHQRLK